MRYILQTILRQGHNEFRLIDTDIPLETLTEAQLLNVLSEIPSGMVFYDQEQAVVSSKGSYGGELTQLFLNREYPRR